MLAWPQAAHRQGATTHMHNGPFGGSVLRRWVVVRASSPRT